MWLKPESEKKVVSRKTTVSKEIRPTCHCLGTCESAQPLAGDVASLKRSHKEMAALYPVTPLWVISSCSNYCTEQESNIWSTTNQVATNISLKGMMIKLIFMVHFSNEMPPWNVNQIWQNIGRKIVHEKKRQNYIPPWWQHMSGA